MTFLYILFAILIFGLLIFIHELGHYASARIFKVKINEFAIGMGPKIISRKSKKTDIVYSLRLLPFGGFVAMEGEDGVNTDPNALVNKAPWKRFLVLAAGAAMNIIFAVVVMFALVGFTATDSDGNSRLASNKIALFYTEIEGHENDFDISSKDSGLKEGDVVIKVGSTYTHIGQDVGYEIMRQGIAPIDITVIRDGETIVLKDVVFPTSYNSGSLFGERDFMVYADNNLSVFNIFRHSFYRSLNTVSLIWDSLYDLITGRYGIEAVSGPVGVTEVIVETAQTGQFQNVVYLAVVIAMNLGIFNLLPLPALDGGRLVFILFEMIFRKPINRKVEGYIHAVGLFIMLAFIVFITFKDIVKLF